MFRKTKPEKVRKSSHSFNVFCSHSLDSHLNINRILVYILRSITYLTSFLCRPVPWHQKSQRPSLVWLPKVLLFHLLVLPPWTTYSNTIQKSIFQEKSQKIRIPLDLTMKRSLSTTTPRRQQSDHLTKSWFKNWPFWNSISNKQKPSWPRKRLRNENYIPRSLNWQLNSSACE